MSQAVLVMIAIQTLICVFSAGAVVAELRGLKETVKVAFNKLDGLERWRETTVERLRAVETACAERHKGARGA